MSDDRDVHDILYVYIPNRPIQVAARSKAWACGSLLSGTVGSNPAGGISGCLLRLLCVVR